MSCVSLATRTLAASRIRTGARLRPTALLQRPPLFQTSRQSTAARARQPSIAAASRRRVLEASSSTVGLVAAASLVVGASVYLVASHSDTPPAAETASDRLESSSSSQTPPAQTARAAAVALVDDNMASEEPAPGRIGSLTPEQEAKLRQLWAAMFRVYQYDPSGAPAAADGEEAADNDEEVAGAEAPSTAGSIAASDGKKKDKKKRSLFKRSKKETSAAGSSSDVSVAAVTKAVGTVDLAAVSEDDKYGQGKLFQDALASQSAESIRDTIWSMVKHDHPDALVLRFLRARKWDVDKALVMLISTMHWRSQEMHVDDDIMMKGEGGAVEAAAATTTTSADDKAKTISEDFLAQMRMGKSFLHGCDKLGRPICVVRVRLHHQGDQVEESVERCTVYTIETARMALSPPVDTATIIFDMTGFSLANMDYSPVKFMIKCFEANYPECLGAVLVHKAPWLFQGIWKIIRGWLDPVVASKVHFTNNVKDVEAFISRDKIIKELGGDEDWEYAYVEPEPGENDRMKDTATRAKLLAERETLYSEFEAATAQWVQAADGEQAKAVQARRDEIAERLRDDYWVLDPYLRARSVYDRTGMLQPGGKVDYYPRLKKDEITQTNGSATAQSDVD